MLRFVLNNIQHLNNDLIFNQIFLFLIKQKQNILCIYYFEKKNVR